MKVKSVLGEGGEFKRKKRVNVTSLLTLKDFRKTIINGHIIVGDGRRCICGIYGHEQIIRCGDILGILDKLETKGEILYGELLKINEVIRSLVQDCDKPVLVKDSKDI